MKINRKRLGTLGEAIAAERLKGNGMLLIEKNYRCPLGEIDLIMKDRSYFVFVEVKTRSSDEFGSPAEAVNYHKVSHIRRTACYYLSAKGLNGSDVRFDTVEVLLRHTENCF